MSDTAPLVESKYGYATFSRKLSDGNYGMTEASVMIPFEYDPSGTDDAISVNELACKLAFIEAKTAAYRELSVDTKSLDDGTIVETAVNVIKAAFPGTTTATGNETSGSTQRPSGGGGGSIKVFKRLEVDGEKVGNPDWLKDQILAAEGTDKAIVKSGGSYELWDNRAKLPQFGGDGNPKSPWFRDKNGGQNANGVWPPKGHPDNAA